MTGRLAGVAAIITIFAFLTGIYSVRQLSHKEDAPPREVRSERRPTERRSAESTPARLPTNTREISPSPRSSTLERHKGAIKKGQGFSFVLGKITARTAGDIYLHWPGSTSMSCNGGTKAYGLGAVDFEGVKECREYRGPGFFSTRSNYNDGMGKLTLGEVYCIRIPGPLYAKIYILDIKPETRTINTMLVGRVEEEVGGTVFFEYVLQRDGSRRFD